MLEKLVLNLPWLFEILTVNIVEDSLSSKVIFSSLPLLGLWILLDLFEDRFLGRESIYRYVNKLTKSTNNNIQNRRYVLDKLPNTAHAELLVFTILTRWLFLHWGKQSGRRPGITSGDIDGIRAQ